MDENSSDPTDNDEQPHRNEPGMEHFAAVNNGFDSRSEHERFAVSDEQNSQAALLLSRTSSVGSPLMDKVKYRTPEDVLAKFGCWNPRILFIVFSMAAIWGVTAMPIMVAAFAVKGIECKDDNPDCKEEAKRFYSIVTQFDLNNFWAESFFSFFFLGNMVFGTILAYFADVVGRRKVVVWSLGLTGVSGILCSLSNNFMVMLIFRTIQGCFYTPTSMVNWVLASESICFKAHGHASMLFGLFWVLGYCSIAGVAYILPNWHHMVLAASVPALFFFVLFYYTIPESFYFLVEKKKKTEVEKWIKKAEGTNPILKLNCDIDHLLASSEANLDEEGNTLSTTIKFLMDNKIYIFYLVASTFMWIFDILVYNGMSLFSTTLVGNPYWNFVLSGAIEIPAYLFSPELMNRLGRKKTVLLSHFFTSMCLLPLVFINMSNKWLYVCFWLLGKLGTSVSFISLFVYGSEIFPTNIKNTCLGIAALFGNLGGVLAYQTHELTHIYFGLPMILFSSLSFISGLVIFGFPETASHDLLADHHLA